MARFVSYKCPDCRGLFRYLHHPSDAPPPDRCPLCKAWVSDEAPISPVFEPKAPRIRKSKYVKSVDASYRAMEAASIQRADEAADKLADVYRADNKNDPHQGNQAILDEFQRSQVAEVRSSMKMTDMVDPTQMRPGDTATVPGAEAARQRLSTPLSAPGFQQLGGVIDNHAPGIGPVRAGDSTRQLVASNHSTQAAAMIRAGQLGSYTPPKK